MKKYDNIIDLSSPGYERDQGTYPILHAHWPGFAAEVAASEISDSWVHPDDLEFTDRPPPGAPSAAKPKELISLDIVAGLRAKLSAA